MQPESSKEFLTELVKIPSVNQYITQKPCPEAPVGNYIKETALSFGLQARFLEVPGCAPNLLVTKEFNNRNPWIIFASHMDTVSADGMDFDPFCGIEKDGRILGRGACDDKGCIAASLWALKELQQENTCKNNIALLFTADEEQQRSGASAFCRAHLSALGFKPSGIIVAEPTSLKPIVAHAGIGHFSVTVKGISAHASTPFKGRSAIKDMIKIIDVLEKDYIANLTATDPLCGRAQCSINMIIGGRQINAIPDECVIHVDRRVMPGEKTEEVIPEVEKVLEKLKKSDPAISFMVSPQCRDNPLHQDLNNPFIISVLNSLAKQGFNAQPRGAAFATDAGAFSAAGIPCVVIGPGEAGMCHTANESMGISELEHGVKVFKTLMRDI